ncbi:MAG: HAMP domain-containing protein [Chloroflexota bacterium]
MTTPESNSRSLFISMRIKLLFGFTLLFSVVFAAAFYWFYSFATETAMNRITEDLVGTIVGATEKGIYNLEGVYDTVSATQTINGDELEALIQEAQPDEDGYTTDPRYWDQVNTLCEIRRIESRSSPYTYIHGEKPNELVFITSWGACMDPKFGAPFKFSWETDNIGPNLAGLKEITLQDDSADGCTYGTAGCKPTPYEDDFGTWISAFAPIRNSKGEVVAALGVDFEASYVQQVQKAILDQVYLAFGITYATLFLLVFLVSQVITRPIAVLTGAADKIGEGQYDDGLSILKAVKISERFPDEIHTLTRVFEAMVNKVYQREQSLRREVEELRIEIDEVKRAKAVGEIVESEFFQDLSQKANEMRKMRRQRKGGGETGGGEQPG